MTPNVTKPITALVSGIAQFFWFMWVGVRAAIRKLFTPAKWNYGEQLRRTPEDVRNMRKAAPHVFRNAIQNAAEFVDIRDRGNNGPRK